LGIKEFVIGMPHRGRLNVLATSLLNLISRFFSEFEGKGYDDNFSLGDVKYHLGYSAEMVSRKGEIIKLHLSPNPSHLEAVNPVVEVLQEQKSTMNIMIIIPHLSGTDSRRRSHCRSGNCL
jgi:2-oxoglutarate dehydrogenase E1 component